MTRMSAVNELRYIVTQQNITIRLSDIRLHVCWIKDYKEYSPKSSQINMTISEKTVGYKNNSGSKLKLGRYIVQNIILTLFQCQVPTGYPLVQ